jgi:hypothetical protein
MFSHTCSRGIGGRAVIFLIIIHAALFTGMVSVSHWNLETVRVVFYKTAIWRGALLKASVFGARMFIFIRNL